MSTLNHEADNSLVSNAFGFMRLPLVFSPYDQDLDWIITGVPFDMATSGRSGARFGPAAIRQISTQLAWEEKRYPWDFAWRKHIKAADCGDLVFSFGDASDMCQKLQSHAEKLLKNNTRMLTLGGDHFITLPLLRAHAKTFGTMALIHFDAHTDTYPNGSLYDHGTMFHHAPLEGLIDPASSVQIGIRTEYDAHLDFTVLDASTVNDQTVKQTIHRIKNVVKDRPIYLSVDIDCLDPAYAPGTGTPVIGGLSSDKLIKILRGLKALNIVGMDVVETAPPYDHGDITALAAATVALELLHLQAYKKQHP